MSLPLFEPGRDPGPSFMNLLQAGNSAPLDLNAADLMARASTVLEGLPKGVVHGTTVVGLKWSDGIIMAGDRRATSGNLISYRQMEKVFPADSHSGVAIAGVAGPAIEMVRLIQLQLEHYEKIEDKLLSLDGKANQLATFLKGNLPAAMQGLLVIPIFGGYDLDQEKGRLFNYDITGGRYEEQEYAAVGSGSLHAGTVIKLGHNPGMDRGQTIDLILNALYQAADEDTGTGGPDPLRGIYPTAALITKDGYKEIEESEISERFAALTASGGSSK